MELNKEILQLINDCRSHLEAAQKKLFIILAPKIKTLCVRYSRTDEDAKDDFQDCMIKIFSHLNDFDAQRGEFFAWAYQVGRNTICSKLRKQKIKWDELKSEHISDQISEAGIDRQLETEEMLSLIQQMPVGYKAVLNLYVFEECSHKEIGELLGINESTSRSQLNRARMWLKAKISESKLVSYEKAII
ncbi:MAG TPA: sigma-70 family RNA polymerase sigma factor [Saprospiraceae bacterium]|nr:sigma-70 family RNA polymerase sigma factor [Saprospiraceae bacterium]